MKKDYKFHYAFGTNHISVMLPLFQSQSQVGPGLSVPLLIWIMGSNMDITCAHNIFY